MTKSAEYIEKMNDYGKRKIPFIFIIDFLQSASLVIPLDADNPSIVKYKVKSYINFNENSVKNDKISLNKFPVSFDIYKKSFDIVHHNLKHGNSYLTNLTFPTKIATNLTLEEIFSRANAPYKLLYENQFVVFSPETFIEIYDNKIFSHPMKGTIDAAIPNAEQIILSDKKEIAEHTTIVDLIRNDLSMVASEVKVTKFKYITHIKTSEKNLLQVSSEISGDLPDNYNENLGTIISTLLPAGSITGAPKKKTVDIIQQSETYDRGFYTGIFGIFDGENLDSAVMIRFIENVNGELFFKSGGGITFMSEPDKEYQELIDKVYVPID